MADPRNGKDGNNSRAELEASTTLAQERKKNEDSIFNYQLKLLNDFVKASKEAQNAINSFNRDSLRNFEYEREELLQQYLDKVQQGIITESKARKQLNRALEKAAKDQVVNQNKTTLTNITNDQKNLVKERQKTNKKIAELEQKLDKETDAKKRKVLENNLKRQQGHLRSLNKEEKKNLEALAKSRKAIMDNAENKRVGWAARADASGKIGDGTGTADVAGVAMNDITNKFEENLNNFVNGFKEMFEGTIQQYGEYQSKVNTRLQGSSYDQGMGAWQGRGFGDGLEGRLSLAIGVNPLVKMTDVMENLMTAIDTGIAYQVEQRAFLQTVKEDIATTFDAFNSNLLRVIRLQQNDSTAARLGMEASLTQFFNSYFNDTTYLSDVYDSVSSSLTEAIAQMTGAEGVAFEYQVQKWLGSLYSLGFSDSSITNIAQALGMLGSGDVSGLSGNSMQNLIVMAASRAGLSYADILTRGITSEETNTLLQSMVEYLQEIATSDNKVVKSQYSNIFGLTTSDLKAAENLGDTISNIAKSSMSYASAVDELYSQMNNLYSRVSLSEMVANLKDNAIYSMGTTIAQNPVTYALWEITSMIEDLTGGIALPTFSIMGNMVDLNTTVTNLMRTGIVGVSTLGAIGDIISGVGSTLNPSSMLSKLGITNESTTIKRGKGINRNARLTKEVSQSTTVGNSSGDDYYDQTVTDANNQTDTMIETKKAESTDITLNHIHEYLLGVFDPKMNIVAKGIASLAGIEGVNFSS